MNTSLLSDRYLCSYCLILDLVGRKGEQYVQYKDEEFYKYSNPSFQDFGFMK